MSDSGRETWHECRGSYSQGDACGRCSRCREDVAKLLAMRAERDNLKELLGLMFERWQRSVNGFDLNPAELHAIGVALDMKGKR